MALEEALVKRVARLARLELSQHELTGFRRELASILGWFASLDRVSTRGVKPSFQPHELRNVFRADRPAKPISQEQALAGTRHKERGFFKGPRAV